MRRRIAILGATGSIGKSTLDLVERSPERFEVVAVTASTNTEELARIAGRTGAKLAVVADESRLGVLQDLLAGTGCSAEADSHYHSIDLFPQPSAFSDGSCCHDSFDDHLGGGHR